MSTALQPLFPTDGSRNVGPSSLSPVAYEHEKHHRDDTPLVARPFQGGFPRGLGPTNPCPSTVHMETDSASIFCVLHRIIATTTKICTGCTVHAGSRRALLPVLHAPLHTGGFYLPQRRWTIGGLLKHRPFWELVHSAGELLHTPWPIPTSMATALLSSYTNILQWGLSKQALRFLRSTIGSSRVASSAYQKWPTWEP